MIPGIFMGFVFKTYIFQLVIFKKHHSRNILRKLTVNSPNLVPFGLLTFVTVFLSG